MPARASQGGSERPLLDITRWGPSAWHFMTSIALAAPETFTSTDKEHYKTFFESLPPVLPCPICGVHFKQKLPVPASALHGRTSLFQWVVDQHNEVNLRARKRTWSYDEVKHIYYQWHTKADEGKMREGKKHVWGKVLGVALLLIVGTYASFSFNAKRKKKC